MGNDIRNQLLNLIHHKLQRLAIHENEIGDSFDLVRTGLLNSLEFVDLVASLEKMNETEIDFESALEAGDFTTMGGVVKAFEKGR